MNCRACESDLPRRTGNRGRPPLYCSAACREAGVRAYRQAHKDEVNAWRRAHDTRPRKAIEIVSGRCAHCGAEFIGPGTKKFCSKSCKSKFSARAYYQATGYQTVCDLDGCDRLVDKRTMRVCQTHRQRMKRLGSYEAPPRVCPRCDQTFVPEDRTDVVFCSGCREYQPIQPRPRVCTACGSVFVLGSAKASSEVCSRSCAMARRRAYENGRRVRQPMSQRECPHCGSTFESSNPRQRHCSTKCGDRAAHSRRRAVRIGAYVEDVWRAKVYARDGYVCQLCRKPMKMSAEVPHPKAPTLDHVIPLVHGGTHEYANVQAAHFICNSRKSAGDAQLNLSLIGVA